MKVIAARLMVVSNAEGSNLGAAHPGASRLEAPKYDLCGAQFAGGFAETVQQLRVQN